MVQVQHLSEDVCLLLSTEAEAEVATGECAGVQAKRKGWRKAGEKIRQGQPETHRRKHAGERAIATMTIRMPHAAQPAFFSRGAHASPLSSTSSIHSLSSTPCPRQLQTASSTQAHSRRSFTPPR